MLEEPWVFRLARRPRHFLRLKSIKNGQITRDDVLQRGAIILVFFLRKRTYEFVIFCIWLEENIFLRNFCCLDYYFIGLAWYDIWLAWNFFVFYWKSKKISSIVIKIKIESKRPSVLECFRMIGCDIPLYTLLVALIYPSQWVLSVDQAWLPSSV